MNKVTTGIILLLASVFIVGSCVVTLQDIVAEERMEVWEMCNNLK